MLSKVVPGKDFHFSLAGYHERDNAYIFSGEENSLMSERTYNTAFICDYKMHWFPFDTQTCYMDLVMRSNADRFVELEPDLVDYTGRPAWR